MKISWILSKLKQSFLDLLFPQKASTRNIENMSLSVLASLDKAEVTSDSWIRALFSYKNETVRQLIWQIKYKGNTVCAEKVGSVLADEILSELSDRALFLHERKPLLIPIPLSRARLRERGWNQSELVGEYISRKIHELEIRTDILIKHVHTLPQTKTKNRQVRLENIAGCFKVVQIHAVHDRTVFLLDDVTTTGATLSEARKVLLKAGAKDVFAYTIAH